MFNFFTPGFNGNAAPKGNPYQAMGLLTPEAKQQAQGMALLQLGAGLLDAGAPSFTPRSLGQGLSRGAMNAAQAYQSSIDGAVNRNFRAQQMQRQNEQYIREQKKREAYQKMFTPQPVPITGGPTNQNVQLIGQTTTPIQKTAPNLTPMEMDFLRLADPDTGMAYLMNKNKPTVMSPGSTMYQNGKPVFTAPGAVKKPSQFQMLLQQAGIKPGTPEAAQYAKEWLNNKGKSPTTNIHLKNEGETLKQIGAKNEKFRSSLAQAATSAEGTLRISEEYRKLNNESKNNPEITSLPDWGFNFLKTLANAAGVDSTALNNRTSLDQKATEFVRELYNSMGGARGITDTELKTFTKLYAEASNNPKARDDLLDWIDQKAIGTMESYRDFQTEAQKQKDNPYWRADEYVANRATSNVAEYRKRYDARIKAKEDAKKLAGEKPGLPSLVNKILKMGKNELSKLDISKMSPAELEAARARFEEIRQTGGF